METVHFFAGVLVCGLVLQAGDLAHGFIERQLRIRAARRRLSRLA